MSLALKDFKPDVVHIHDFFPLLPLATYKVCRRAGSAVVQTLRNYGLSAAAAARAKSAVCAPTVRHFEVFLRRCYRGSIVGSACRSAVASMRKRSLSSPAPAGERDILLLGRAPKGKRLPGRCKGLAMTLT